MGESFNSESGARIDAKSAADVKLKNEFCVRIISKATNGSLKWDGIKSPKFDDH